MGNWVNLDMGTVYTNHSRMYFSHTQYLQPHLILQMFRPDTGYVQGMSFVAGTLLLNGFNEFEAFLCFANMLNREFLFHFYQFDKEKVNVVFNVFMRLMKDRLPKLHTVFKQTGLPCSAFLFEWVVTIFSNIFSLDIAARIWDQYLFYGDFFLIKVSLAICHCLEPQILQSQLELLITPFKNVQKYVSGEQLFKAIKEVKMSKKQFEAL